MFSWMNCKICETNLLLSSAHFFQEGFEWNETILVLGVAELSHQVLGLLLGQLLTEVGEEQEQLMGQHGVVIVFVVQLQDLNKVVEATLVLGVLGVLVCGVALILGKDLLALLGLTSDLSDGLEGGVQVAGADEVTQVEGVNLAISLEVIDVKGKVDGVNLTFLKTKFSHV
jgi:putative Mn2+ efflux pump MntP